MNRLPRLRKQNLEAQPKRKTEEPLWVAGLRARLKSMRLPLDYKVLLRVLSRSPVMAEPVKRAIIRNAVAGYETSAKAGARTVNHAAILLNAIVASDISHSLEAWMKQLVESSPTVYDRAADAVYNATPIGGGQLHRLFDGSHTIWGMWDKTHNALPDDSFVQETAGYFSTLWHDLGTHVGIPVATLNKANYNQWADFLKETFHIPKPWLQDLLHVNGVEFFGASLGFVAVAFQWKRKDVKQFSALCGHLGVSAVISANPALGVLALACLAKSFMDAKHQGTDYKHFVNGLAKGGVGSGLILGTSAVVGGPALVGLIAGMCVGVAAYKTLDTVEVSEISKFLVAFVKEHVPARSVAVTELLPFTTTPPR